jgi:hypothetical protein
MTAPIATRGRPLKLPPLFITRGTPMACDECGEQPIAFREPNTVYLDPQCATAYIEDPDLWWTFKSATGAVTVKVSQ